MEWIKCSERMPEKLGNYQVCVIYPPTPDQGFFKGSPERKAIMFATYKVEKFLFKEDEEMIYYKKKKAFYGDCFDFVEMKLDNVTYWLEVTLPGEG